MQTLIQLTGKRQRREQAEDKWNEHKTQGVVQWIENKRKTGTKLVK